MYQFSATIKAVKTGNLTIRAYRINKGMYLSVSKDSACIRDEPFPELPVMAVEGNWSEFEKMRANMTRTASKSSRYNFTPRPGNFSDVEYFDLWWDGTGWKWVELQNQS